MIPVSRLFGKTRNQRLLVALVLIEALIVIILEAVVYAALTSVDSWALRTGSRGLPVYLILFIMAQLFSCVLVADALVAQNTIQLLGFCFFNFCCLIYAILQVSQVQLAQALYVDAIALAPDWNSDAVLATFTKLTVYIIIVCVIISLCQAIYAYLAIKLYKEFGWTVYKKIGADLQKKNMYRSYHIFLMLLKLDFFFFLGFAIQLMMLVLRDTDIEKGLTIAALPVIFLILLGAVYGVRNEHRSIMLIFMVGLALAIVYFIFKVVRIYTDEAFGRRDSKYFGVSIYLTVFAILSLIMVIGTLVYSIICYLNFDKGLKPFHMRQKNGRKSTNDVNTAGPRLVLEDDDDEPRPNIPPDHVYAVQESMVQTHAAPPLPSKTEQMPPSFEQSGTQAYYYQQQMQNAAPGTPGFNAPQYQPQMQQYLPPHPAVHPGQPMYADSNATYVQNPSGWNHPQ